MAVCGPRFCQEVNKNVYYLLLEIMKKGVHTDRGVSNC